MKSSISYQALDEPLTLERINAAQKRSGVKMIIKSRSDILWVLLVGVFVSGVILMSIEGSGINRTAAFFAIIAAILSVTAVIYLYQKFNSKRLTARRLRLENFAQDNGLHYTPTILDPEHQGVLFSEGSDRKLVDVLSSGGRYEIGNYSRMVQSGKNTVERINGYIRIQLPRHVAHMILDGKANNMNIFGASFSNLDAAFNKDQILKLEGDFNDHFTLYAPKEYERDAFYVFTPDLMALLIDHVSAYDVEVVDNQLFIYSSKFELLNKATLEKIFTIISTVGGKTISQTDYYADENVGNRTLDVVADKGRRLKHGLSWQLTAFMVIYLVYAIIQMFTE